MLVTSLVESERFIVIERAELDEILKEQGLGQTGLVTPQSAAKVGQLQEGTRTYLMYLTFLEHAYNARTCDT